ncbi:MauE/DoxX family redox-associated membrane protein [Nocardia amikacinitolerans]|uniref:MauE/DoxX family redox-associated membrane protein n=1 Tax=Nocardia amikacinitolerans TaxID=756689 RepID=UPI0020A2F03B|nr:MauE/DoxX family redox-associated membrane protein [Nocardia amikacinitolerans]MCP2291268.1 methylamine dehydrogenase accessory protein MauD [Nocardia amikacinitolerans]
MLIEYGVWVTRLALAVVFGLSAWGKLTDRAGTRQAVGDFGVPVRWVPAVAWGLPVVEAVLAVGVVLPWTAAAAAIGVLLLLTVFTAVIVRLLRLGKRPACSCFGAASATPIGARSIVRNGVLMLLAALVLWGAIAYPSVPEALPADAATGLALVAVLCAVLAWLVGQVGALRRRLDEQALSTLGAEGLPVGSVAPEFELLDVAGERTNLADLLAPGRPVLLVFVHPGCELCAALARELPRWQARTALTIVVVGNGDAAEQAAWGVEQGLGDIPSLVQQGNEAALRYRVRGTPSAVLIDTDGRVAAPVARGAIATRELIVAKKSVRTQLSSRSNGQRAAANGRS